MNVLVTGGAGYIGSHTVLELLDEGFEVHVVDNLSNSSSESLNRVAKLANRPVGFHEFDLRDEQKLSALFKKHKFTAVIHFAGLKVVDESTRKPLEYYDNNLDSTLRLCEVMQKHGVWNLIFSSSAAVYGAPAKLPLTEHSRTGVGITNPYGRTKFMLEQILTDLSVAEPNWQITLLRYFNPIGAHPSGQIGENPEGRPTNILPYISQVAVGKLKKLHVYGDDYDTPDGTGIRDYIHVVDLARGHVAALKHVSPGAEIYNLGTGRGTSVLELIAAFSKVSQQKITYVIDKRRPSDLAVSYADPSKAYSGLGWRAEKTIEDACRDAWNWQSQNPNGY